MALARGEDRSAYQRPGLSWSESAFGFTKRSEGVSFADPTFESNWANLKAEGKVRGAYHFFHPALSPIAQAQYFVDQVRQGGGYGPGDVFVVDVEVMTDPDDGHEVAGPRALDRAHLPLQQLRGPGLAEMTLGSAALSVLEEVSRLVGPHNPVVLYADLFYAETYLGSCRDYQLFVADYSSVPPGKPGAFPRWTFWQSEGGGGQGGGDTDWFREDEAGLLAWHKSYLPKPPAELPAWQKAIYARLPRLEPGTADVTGAGTIQWVRQAQLLLGITGEKVKVDGVLGTATETSVKALQKAHGIDPDGVVNKSTWAVLAAGTEDKELPHLSGGQVDGHGPYREVHRAQALCNAHGVPLTMDGSYGPSTAAAVRSIQRSYGVTGSGTVDAETWSLLLAHAKP